VVLRKSKALVWRVLMGSNGIRSRCLVLFVCGLFVFTFADRSLILFVAACMREVAKMQKLIFLSRGRDPNPLKRTGKRQKLKTN
jgi:hypothetical protein